MASLRFGVLVPVLYFGTLLVSSLLYPGYSHIRQYASELGSASARYPYVFNTGIVLTGLAAFLSLGGFHDVLRRLRSSRTLIWLFLVTLGAFAAGMVMGGLFPMPDPRHGGFGLGFGVHVAPVLLAAALWRTPSARGLRWFLAASAVAGMVMLAIMMGAGSLVRRANVGAFQRMYATANFLWIGIASYALRKSPDESSVLR